MHVMRFTSNQDGFINFGWRGWEGELPTSFIRHCADHPTLDERTMVYYDETIELSASVCSHSLVIFIKTRDQISLEELHLQAFSHIWELQSKFIW